MVEAVSGGVIDFSACDAALEWSVATRAKVSGYNGDAFLLRRDERTACAYVIDGIGSGRDAHASATASVDVLSGLEACSLERQFSAVHKALSGHRGVALGCAEIDVTKRWIQWAAIGDIDGLVMRSDGSTESMIQRGGTLGISYSNPHIVHCSMPRGDVLVMTSDGVSRRFREALPQADNLDKFTASVLECYGRQSDDCIVLALRVLAKG